MSNAAKKPKFATQYNFRLRGTDFGTHNTEDSLTQQSDRNETDINVIVKRYAGTGMLPQVQMEALTGDFTNVGDFREAQEKVRGAREAFLTIPAEIRQKFGNDPGKFIEFASNPENADALVELKLAEKKKPTHTPPTPIPAQEEKNGNNDQTGGNGNDPGNPGKAGGKSN